MSTEVPTGSFGHALAMLKAGQRVARAGWNGKGMWLALNMPCAIDFPANHFHASPLDEHARSLKDGLVRVNPSIVMKTADGSFCVGWLASQADMLAEDWSAVA